MKIGGNFSLGEEEIRDLVDDAVGEVDTGEKTYDFLTTWGSEDGKIGCNDKLLTGKAAFPGKGLKPILNDSGVPTPESGIVAKCNEGVFDELDANAAAELGKMMGLVHTEGALVFIKSEQLVGVDTIKEEKETDPTSTRNATRINTTKQFVGGSFFADMSTTGGNDESGERAILYSNCPVGTAPSDLRGDWRAVQTIKTVQEYSEARSTVGEPTIETTTKVCLRLDSIPGTVKCFIEDVVNAPGTEDDTTKEQIAIYDDMAAEDMKITPVAPKAAVTTGLLAVPANTDGAVANSSVVASNLFGTGVDLDADNVSKLCALFEEAGAVGE